MGTLKAINHLMSKILQINCLPFGIGPEGFPWRARTGRCCSANLRPRLAVPSALAGMMKVNLGIMQVQAMSVGTARDLRKEI
jgi:hypothetical protein